MQNLINARHVLVSYCVFELGTATDLLKKNGLNLYPIKYHRFTGSLLLRHERKDENMIPKLY